MSHFYSKGRDSLRIGKSFPNHDIVSHYQQKNTTIIILCARKKTICPNWWEVVIPMLAMPGFWSYCQICWMFSDKGEWWPRKTALAGCFGRAWGQVGSCLCVWDITNLIYKLKVHLREGDRKKTLKSLVSPNPPRTSVKSVYIFPIQITEKYSIVLCYGALGPI